MLKRDVNDVLNLREIGAEFDCLAPEINELPDGEGAAYNGGELFYSGGGIPLSAFFDCSTPLTNPLVSSSVLIITLPSAFCTISPLIEIFRAPRAPLSALRSCSGAYLSDCGFDYKIPVPTVQASDVSRALPVYEEPLSIRFRVCS